MSREFSDPGNRSRMEANAPYTTKYVDSIVSDDMLGCMKPLHRGLSWHACL